MIARVESKYVVPGCIVLLEQSAQVLHSMASTEFINIKRVVSSEIGNRQLLLMVEVKGRLNRSLNQLTRLS